MNTDKKTCPNCSKQLPVTASNCKYCGATLGETRAPSLFDSLDNSSARPKSMPPRPPASKVPPPPPSVSSAAPPPPPPPIGSAAPPPPPPVSSAPPPSAPSAAPPSPSAADEDEADDWIPEADEASALINLDHLPLPSENRSSHDDATNPSISTSGAPSSEEQTVVSSASQDESKRMSDSRLSGTQRSTDSVVAQVFGDKPAGNKPSAEVNSPEESSALIDLDGLEDPDAADSVAAEMPSEDASGGPAADKALDENAPLFSEDSSADLSGLMSLDAEDSDADIDLENSEPAIIPNKGSAPPPRPGMASPGGNASSGPAIPRPSGVPPVRSSAAPAGSTSVPPRPSVPSRSPVGPSTEPPTASTPPRPAAAAISDADKTNVMPRPEGFDAAPIRSAFAPTGPSVPPAPNDLNTIPPRGDASGAVIGSDIGGVDEILYSTPPDAYDDADAGDGGHSTKKIVIVSASAFVVTLFVALIIAFMSNDSEKIDVDSESVELKQEAVGTNASAEAEKEKQLAKNKPLGDTAISPEKKAPPKVEPLAKNCLPLSRYFAKFPWKKHFGKLLDAQNYTRICELFGSTPQMIATAMSDMTMVGPTGYDWIAEGGRIEVYPGNSIGAREPSIEFLFSGNKLFRIKAKFRNSKAGRRADADELQTIFKKENETKDHLGRTATTFDEQDMVVKLLEEEWYGQTLRTLEFSSVKLNDALAGHLEKLDSLETVYKKAEAAYFGWKFDEALKAYEEVNAMAPALGAAIVKRGLISLRNDDFGNARSLADDALEVSIQDDVKAEAKGILAVNALRNGDKEGALKQLYEAKKLAPASARFASHIEQLESGEYSIQSIAQTAARLACIEEGKSKASVIGVLARGFFPDKQTYQKSLKKVNREKEFKETRDNLMVWECK